MHEFFSTDFNEARTRFLAAADASGAEIESFGCPARGPGGEELFTDTARHGAKTARSILVVMSGTHGVEGFAGSAIQTGLLCRDVSRLLAPDTALLMIHALNPFGFAHLRRVNEDNVDLNRNFLDFSQTLLVNPEYDRLADVIAPRSLGLLADLSLNWRLFRYRRSHGLAMLQKAVTSGQCSHPRGLFFAGERPTWSNRILRTILKEQLTGATRVVVLDLHTGLGPSGFGEIIVGDPPGAPVFERAKRWWGERVRSTEAGESVSAHLSGTVRNAFHESLPDIELTTAGLEFGTLPAMDVFRAMRAENWLHHYGTPEHPAAAGIRATFLQAFSPDDDAWRAQVWRQGEEAVVKVLPEL